MTTLLWVVLDNLGIPSPPLLDVLELPARLAFPVAVAVAVLRYRLYDIDRLISRSVSYAMLTGVLGAVYAAGVVLLGGLLRPLGAESELAVAGSTLGVAAVFGSARRRVQAVVDRRFNRARYDAERTIEALRARLRDEVDLDQLTSELLAAVHHTVQPARASLWLRNPDADGSAL